MEPTVSCSIFVPLCNSVGDLLYICKYIYIHLLCGNICGLLDSVIFKIPSVHIIECIFKYNVYIIECLVHWIAEPVSYISCNPFSKPSQIKLGCKGKVTKV